MTALNGFSPQNAVDDLIHRLAVDEIVLSQQALCGVAALLQHSSGRQIVLMNVSNQLAQWTLAEGPRVTMRPASVAYPFLRASAWMAYPISANNIRLLILRTLILPTSVSLNWINQKNSSPLAKSPKSACDLAHISSSASMDISLVGLYFLITGSERHE
jgi:hypothetical protein